MCLIAAELGMGLRGPDERLCTARLTAEFADLGAASRWAVEAGEVDLALRVIVPYGYFGHWQLRYQLFDWAAAAADMKGADTHPMFGEVIGLVALAGWLTGDHERAWDAIGHAAAASSLKDAPGLSLPVAEAMMSVTVDHNWDQAISIADEQLPRAEDAGDTWLTTFWTYIGAQWRSIAGMSDVEQRAQAALELAEQHGYESLAAEATQALAHSYRISDPTRARALGVEAARRALEVGSYYIEGTALTFMLSIPVPDAQPEELIAELIELITGRRRAQAAVLTTFALGLMVEPLIATGHPQIAASVYGAVDASGGLDLGHVLIDETGLDQAALSQGRSLSLSEAVALVETIT
jgi:hypothetical protein